MSELNWILFLTQLPARPSSARVSVWRRMKAAGAVSLQNGVWALPHTQKNEQFIKDCITFVESESGSAMYFIAGMPDANVEDALTALFKAAVGQEYREFIERCEGLIGELERESKHGKYTFAELDENEEELQKLTSWLRKIKTRDFFVVEAAQEASSALDNCRKRLQAFERSVYKHEGLDEE